MKPLILTMGEPAGIGPELSIRAWHALRQLPELAFVYLGDRQVLTQAAAVLDLPTPIQVVEHPEGALACFADALPVLQRPLAQPAQFGQLDPRNGACVMEAIAEAVCLVQGGQAAGVVTNPIHKGALYQAGFAYPGHTEYLAALAQTQAPTVMMLACDALRVVPITLHVSLQQAITSLSPALIRHAVVTTHTFLRDHFDLPAPRLAVSGLNPHAGEGGAMGREEIDLIQPVLQDLRAQGLDVRGPLSADTMFHAAARASYDAALCMTHDQALIPIKTLAFDEGVNLTMGLPFVRSSPDHGTALDIAGQGVARPDSLIAAIRMARQLAAKP